MLEKRFFKVRSSLVNVLICIGISFFLCSYSIAMEETKYGLVSLGPTRFPFETLTEIEKKEFSSLVYMAGSTRSDAEEINTYCDNRASHYTNLAHGNKDSLYMRTAEKWSIAYKTKAVTDVLILEMFYHQMDMAGSLIGQLSKDKQTKLIGTIKTQKLQADALFHYFYPYFDTSWCNSFVRKVSRFSATQTWCRLQPDFTPPDEKNRKALYDFYNTIVPMDMRINSNQALPASPTVTDGSCSEEDYDA